MRRLGRLLGFAIVGTIIAATARAQTTTTLGVGGGGSAHVKTEWTISGAHLSVTYGRPRLKGRSEATMMPVGKPWRTGADAATVLTTDKPLTFGAVTLKPGSYTINTQPGQKSWQLIFGRLEKPGQWGVPYLPQLEIARTPMTVRSSTKPVEAVTIRIDRGGASQALVVEWGTISARAPFTIMK